ncbi:Disease resistance protein RPM1 [Forsythia ovata]|uniref:Disease resistance protein RPM1 n=1 Tax=Forsythia ovata TaxID=205694 RepID=A0ABD1TNR9_9LAMI
MAADAVTFALDKLTTLLEEKINMVNDVKQEVEYIRDELERMIAFLRVADAAEDDDPELKVWIKQVRDVAYDTEDIIDDFAIQLHRKNNCCWGGFCDFLGILVCSVRNLKTRYETASEIQSIKPRMREIAEGHRRYRYKFNVPGEGSASGFGSIHGIDSRVDALFLEETELVGIEKPTRQIIPWLVEGESRLKVVSVVGMGGLGKTTLVKKVYDDSVVKKHFQNHAWITVSQSFKVEELLKDMIQQLTSALSRCIHGSTALNEIATMNELVRVSITDLRTEDGVALCLCIEKLQKLCSLGLRSIQGDILDLSHMSSPPLSLQRLYLTGRLAKFPTWIQSLQSLVKVYLRWSQLRDDPLAYLEDLPNLVHLEFLATYVGDKLCFKAGKFQKLKLLSLDKLEPLRCVIIEVGAMPHLEKLLVQRCNSLEVVPEGIECLTHMKVLEFFDMPDEFIVPLSLGNLGKEYWKISHIPEVYHTYWRNGCWEVHPLDKKQTIEKSGQTAIVRTQEQRNWL